MQMINAAIQVMAYLALGYICVKRKWCGPGSVKTLTSIVINIALPCLIVESMMIPFEMEKLSQGLLSVVMVVLILAVCGGCGILWSKLLKPGDVQHQSVIRVGLLYNNFMLIGVPIIEAALGNEGIFYTGLMGLPQRATMFILLPLIYGSVAEGEYHEEFNWRLLLQFPTIAIFVGLFMFITQLQFPAVVMDSLEELGGMTMPLGMMLAGMQLADVDLGEILRDKTVPLVLLIKNMINPLIIFLLLCALRFPTILIQLGTIYAAVPAPAMMVVYAARYKVFPGYAGAIMCLSTICSAVTLPFWAYIITTFVP